MQKWIDKAVDIIVEQYGPDQIILFGSQSKNLENTKSDIDLLIIKVTNTPKYYRGVEVAQLLKKFPIKFDLLFYTPSEVAEGRKKPYSFLYSILKSSKIIYKKN